MDFIEVKLRWERKRKTQNTYAFQSKNPSDNALSNIPFRLVPLFPFFVVAKLEILAAIGKPSGGIF